MVRHTQQGKKYEGERERVREGGRETLDSKSRPSCGGAKTPGARTVPPARPCLAQLHECLEQEPHHLSVITCALAS